MKLQKHSSSTRLLPSSLGCIKEVSPLPFSYIICHSVVKNPRYFYVEMQSSATFFFQQPSPIPNGSYSSPGSAGPPGNKTKGKSGSRPASRDVVFPPSAGQGGPPPQMPPMQNPAVLGLRMDGAPASPAGSPAHGKFSSYSAVLFIDVLMVLMLRALEFNTKISEHDSSIIFLIALKME